MNIGDEIINKEVMLPRSLILLAQNNEKQFNDIIGFDMAQEFNKQLDREILGL